MSDFIRSEDALQHVIEQDLITGTEVVEAIESAATAIKTQAEGSPVKDSHLEWARDVIQSVRDYIEGGDGLKTIKVKFDCPRCNSRVAGY